MAGDMKVSQLPQIANRGEGLRKVTSVWNHIAAVISASLAVTTLSVGQSTKYLPFSVAVLAREGLESTLWRLSS